MTKNIEKMCFSHSLADLLRLRSMGQLTRLNTMCYSDSEVNTLSVGRYVVNITLPVLTDEKTPLCVKTQPRAMISQNVCEQSENLNSHLVSGAQASKKYRPAVTSRAECVDRSRPSLY
jgi:hypothetical protein